MTIQKNQMTQVFPECDNYTIISPMHKTDLIGYKRNRVQLTLECFVMKTDMPLFHPFVGEILWVFHWENIDSTACVRHTVMPDIQRAEKYKMWPFSVEINKFERVLQYPWFFDKVNYRFLMNNTD